MKILFNKFLRLIKKIKLLTKNILKIGKIIIAILE